MLNWTYLEDLVVRAVVEDSYGDCATPEQRRRFLRDLFHANEELYRLSATMNVDYGLPRMGEAYALWYHMRRVANIFKFLSEFEQDLLTSSPSGQWRVLDVGSGTGAGSMAFAFWMHSHGLRMGPSVQTRIMCVEEEDPMLEMADFLLRRVNRAIGSELELLRWRKSVRRIVEIPSLPPTEVFEVMLFSTTFDYIVEPEARKAAIEGLLPILNRLLPDGLAFFLVPSVEAKRSFLKEVGEVLNGSGSWMRLRNFGEAQPVWPEDGTRQAWIAEARGFLHQEARRLGLERTLFPPEREAKRPPTYRNDVDAWVFRRQSTDPSLRNFRRREAIRLLERRRGR